MNRRVPLPCLVFALLVEACVSPRVRMQYRTFDSRAMGRSMEYAVYTPPGFAPGEALPLVLFLHGGGGDEVDCLEIHGVTTFLDEEISKGRVPRVAIVVPQGDRGFWANWADGTRRYQDWALDEALPAARREFGTTDEHLLGISMGGNGVVRFALARPGQFKSMSVLSGPILDAKGMKELMSNWMFRTFARLDRVFGSPDDVARTHAADPFQQWLSPGDVHGLRIFFAHGDGDHHQGLDRSNLAFHEHLEAHHIAHRYVVFRGGHDWQYWTPVFGDALRYALAPEAPSR
jgi:S-formylglutathione hydrolase FrmB